jgi:hypothetical protein
MGDWYGWQILLLDVALVSSQYVVHRYAGEETSDWTATAMVGGYFVGPPLVHLAHDRPAAAAGSLGLRAGAPFVLGVTFQSLASCEVKSPPRGDGSRFDDDDERCEDGAFLFGAVLGVVTAMLLDMSILSLRARPERTHSTLVAPRLRVDSKGAKAELTVRF